MRLFASVPLAVAAGLAAIAVRGTAGAAVAPWQGGRVELAPVDAFHPDHQPGPDGRRPPLPEPAWGGRITAHTDSLPRHLNQALSSSAYTRRILGYAHAWLMRYDARTLEFVPQLARSVEIEDTLVRRKGRAQGGVLFGQVVERGETYVLRGADGEQAYPKSEFESLERGTVFTFKLRDDVVWHDGHPFDAHDVVFSWSIYRNPEVKCDEKRWQHEKILEATALDAHTVRFVYERQYFHALITVGDLFLMPRHLYDPTDPDHAKADPAFHQQRREADPEWTPGPADVAACVNENVHNREFVGLGPYRVASWQGDTLDLVRFDGWFDPASGGYVDTIRWREIRELGPAFRALAAGELDFLDTIGSDDYFGAQAASPEFTRRYYKGTHRAQQYWYVGWNNLSPKLSDPRVRRALAHLADLEAFRQSYYRGLAETMNGPFLPHSPAADPSIAPLAFDPAAAQRLLIEAGWIDRDGDGVRDKDGVPLRIELLITPGNPAASGFGTKLQEDMARAGVRLDVQALDFNVLDARKQKREFEAVALGWAMAPEADPEQAWHSRWGAPDKRGGNFVGLQDEVVDALIEEGQRELDFERRQRVWHRLQARIMELQPYLFCYAPLRKFALSRKLRGFQETAIDPNWNLCDLYFPKGTPGTRDAPRAR